MAIGGFDTVALADKTFGKGDIAAMNAKLHENKVYNGFQLGIGAIAAFTGGMTSAMTCFVAGTLVLTANGLLAIEAIKAGDLVYAADENTLEVSLKPVLETYIRETSHLVHLTVNGETIVSTFDHPYYVKDKGFVSAEALWIGAELVDSKGNVQKVEQLYREDLGDESVKVYNFKVDDYHTYFVGDSCILVHNADYLPTEKQPGFVSRTDHEDGSVTITKIINGKNYDLDYTLGDDGNLYPRFEKYADYKDPNLRNVDFSKPIKLNKPLTGDYSSDAGLLNNQVGLSETPEGYVWHHIEDGKSMLLVPQNFTLLNSVVLLIEEELQLYVHCVVCRKRSYLLWN